MFAEAKTFAKSKPLSKASIEACRCHVFGCWVFFGDRRDKYIPELKGFTSLIILIKMGSGIFRSIHIS